MSWNYAELSKAAKAAGGPEQLVDSIVASAVKQGRASMVPALVAVGGGASVLTLVGVGLYSHFKKKKARSRAVLEEEKTKLIQGIREYDEAHPIEAENENVN